MHSTYSADTKLKERCVIASTAHISKAIIYWLELVQIMPCIIKCPFTINNFLHDVLCDPTHFRGRECAGYYSLLGCEAEICLDKSYKVHLQRCQRSNT